MNDEHPEFDFSDPRGEEKNDILERFKKFHADNPQVYRNLCRLARDVRSRRDKISIAVLYEVLRWEHYFITDTDDEFKMCNDYRAPYARLIMKQEPDLAGLFNTKRSKVDK